jgi:hypothetical protein
MSLNLPPGDVSEWLDMMPDSVTITPRTGRSVTGNPTYTGAIPYSFPCRVEIKNHIIAVNVGGESREIMARGRVFGATTAVPSTEDQITLPSEYVPINPPILAVNVQPDERGTHHVTIEIG